MSRTRFCADGRPGREGPAPPDQPRRRDARLFCLLRDVPTRRRDPASTALAAVFLLSGLSFLFSITPMWNYLDRMLGTVNISVPLAQGCVVALLACQQVVLTYWGSPPEVARRRSRWWLWAASR